MYKPQLVLKVGLWHLLKQIMGFGNPTPGGFTTAKDALVAVNDLNAVLFPEFGVSFDVSAHWWHEILVPGDEPGIGYSAKWNNDRSISLREWKEGIRAKKMARAGHLIPPGFGLPGSDLGAFTNPDPERRQLAEDMVVYSFAKSDEVKREGCGSGDVVLWTGPDGLRWGRLTDGHDVRLGYNYNHKLPEWRMIVGGLSRAAKRARSLGYLLTKFLMEGKRAGDPSYLDVFTDTYLTIMGIREINLLIGATVMYWQDEFCHVRGGGQKFADAMQQAIRADVFDGDIHFNAGGLAAVNFSKLLSRPQGVLASKLQQYVDNDFLPGEGVWEWKHDQKKTLALGARWSAQTGKPFVVEFDARFCRYTDTIGELEKSARWTINTFNEAVAKLEA